MIDPLEREEMIRIRQKLFVAIVKLTVVVLIEIAISAWTAERDQVLSCICGAFAGYFTFKGMRTTHDYFECDRVIRESR